MSETKGKIVAPHGILHKLWTKAVGTDGYNKREWAELEALIYASRHGVFPCPTCAENAKELAAARGLKRVLLATRHHGQRCRCDKCVEMLYTLDSLLEAIKDE